MLLYYFSMCLTILSNVMYHIFQKSTSSKVNPFLSLIVSYLIAITISIILFPFYSKEKTFVESIHELNWASAALGFSIVGLELGFLLIYRSGWSINIAAIFSSVAVTLILIPLGILIYKENLSIINFIGIILCISGLIMVNHK